MTETPGGGHELNDYEAKVRCVSVISKPLANMKLNTRVLKLIKKTAKNNKKDAFFGIKMVQKQIRKGKTGVMVIAGDISHIDSYAHIPAVCEEKNIPYIFVPSKFDLGAALGSQSPTMIVLIPKTNENEELYEKVEEGIQKASIEFV